MDDIRRPYRGERRDYALPTPAHPSRPNAEPVRPAAPQPLPHHPHQPYHQPHHQPTHHPQPAHHQPQPYPQTMPRQHPAPAAAPIRHKRRLKLGLNLPVIIATVLAAAAVLGGYMLLKPAKPVNSTPAQLAQKASFSFYYPQPLPAGYSYIQTINTFQDGQAYYMLGNGRRHLIIRERQSASKNLDLSSLEKPQTFMVTGGKAAIGTTAGEASGMVLAGSTLISINSTGNVPPDDIQAVIYNFKTIAR
jgi:hypothetical protein